jgi:N-acetyl-anhydromuramyl-L-alanine amidase AmpD
MNVIENLLPVSQYVPGKNPKSLIVLHFTAGNSVESARTSWINDPRRVGAHYIVDRDGTVHRTVPDEATIFALGVKGGTPIEQRAIHIEMVSRGPLKLNGNALRWWPNNWGALACGLSDTDQYVKLDAPWRDISYFEKYQPAQIEAVADLCRHLCNRHGIRRVLPPPPIRNVTSLRTFREWGGIAAHDNFRDDKWDVSPAFPWVEFEGLLLP